MAGHKDKTFWQPTFYLEFCQRSSALVILNQPITDLALFKRLWNHGRSLIRDVIKDLTEKTLEKAEFRICADGGANRLYDLCCTTDVDEDHKDYLPDEICGDLDSIRLPVKAYYESAGVTIIHESSQYETDFSKCITRIGLYYLSPVRSSSYHLMDILALGGLGGRVDQAFSLIHQLYIFSGRIFLFSDESISFVLRQGQNVIYTPTSKGYITNNVGIIPVGKPAMISTQGLEWDVSGWATEVGRQVSTSNHIKCDNIEVTTDERILFTVERSKDLPSCSCCSTLAD